MTDAYEVGGRRLGVRWSGPGPAALLARCAGAHRRDADAPPNLSVVLGGSNGAATTKHSLYVQGRQLMTTSNEARLVRAVIRAASALVVEPAAGQVRLDAVPVITPRGSVVVVDRALNHELRVLERRLARRGHRILDCTTTVVDPETGTAAVPDARAAWAIDEQALAELLPAAPGDDDLRRVDGAIARIVHLSHETPESRVAAVAYVAALARRPDGTLRTDDVVRVAALTDRVATVPFVSDASPALLDLLLDPDGP